MTLPTEWQERPLRDLCVPVSNFDPTRHPDTQYGYVDIGAIDNVRGRIVNIKRIQGAQAPSRARRPIRPGDVLFSNVRTYLRNIASVTENLAAELCSTGFTVLRPGNALDGRYLYHYLRSDAFISAVTPEQTGSHYPATSDRVVLGQSIPVPRIEEQRQIANKLDHIAVRLDETKARLDTIPSILKRFRMSVLATACSGRLTEDWRKMNNLPLDAAEHWGSYCFGDLIADGPQNGLYKPASAYGSGVMILRIDSFYDGQITDWTKLKRLRLSTEERKNFALANGDIVVNRVNSMPYLGKSALVRNLFKPCVYESNMMRIRLDRSRVEPEYAIRYLNSPQGLLELRKNAKQAVNQASINQQDVKAVAMALPPLDEQVEIVHRIEAMFQQADAIEARYRKAHAFTDKLMPAVLAKAFRGELA